MSPGEGASKESSPTRRRESTSGRGRPNLIEFVDSQDPNVRSAIQRHTAYHSAAQRRDARSRLLRRSSQTRYLEWARRPPPSNLDTLQVTSPTGSSGSVSARAANLERQQTSSSNSSASSVSISPARSLFERPTPSRRPSSQTDRDPETSATSSGTETGGFLPSTSAETEIFDHFSSILCRHRSMADSYEPVLEFMQRDEASRNLLMAYALALRRMMGAAPDGQQYQEIIQHYLGRGTNILWNRLRSASDASSDVNIQAVLLLVVYATDFETANDAQIHIDALQTMIEQRGGIDAFGHNPALYQQLLAIESSRCFHLTLSCGPRCTSNRRYSQGFWKPVTNDNDRR